MKRRVLASAVATAIMSSFSAHAASDIEELRTIVEAQQDQIDKLSNQLSGNGNSGVNIGGYGELHYNALENQTAGGKNKYEVDFHRFVLFFGKEFSNDVRFFSEFELEHALAGEGKSGEVELEQAFIDVDINDKHTARGGVFLVPVGILNETHEPPTFYGTERNPVEKNIIPSTWWEAGAGVYGELAPGLAYDAYIHSGLNNTSYNIRSGRQKVAKADASHGAFTGRLKWTGVPGLEVAGTLQLQQDITQGNASEKAPALLIETHAVYQLGPFGMRALFASWDIDNDAAASSGKDQQTGFYLEPSYKLNEKLGVFARYNMWDNAAGNNSDSEYTQIDIGANYWIHESVVVKVDYQDQDVPTGKNEMDGFNIGLGYNF